MVFRIHKHVLMDMFFMELLLVITHVEGQA